MSQESRLLSLNLDGNKAVENLSHCLTSDGMHVIRSFDLQTARAAHENGPCPHHGEKPCDCQLIVLLVYDDRGSLLKIIAHSKDRKTHFSLINTPLTNHERRIKSKILQALALIDFSNFKLNDQNT